MGDRKEPRPVDRTQMRPDPPPAPPPKRHDQPFNTDPVATSEALHESRDRASAEAALHALRIEVARIEQAMRHRAETWRISAASAAILKYADALKVARGEE